MLAQANRRVVLPRLHGFEFNDQAWLPAIMRTIVTYAIGQGVVKSRVASRMCQVLAPAVRESGATSILELAAGSAQASVQLVNELERRGVVVSYVVSDKYPDLEAFRSASKTTQGRVTYIEHPVDALHVPGDLQGLRLLVESFHHFRPEQAQCILQGAYERGVPIAVFETTDRRLLRTLSVGPLCVLLMLTLLTKILREHSWRGALWFLPATFAFAWDGFVSCLRSYTLRELASMTRALSDGYHWSMGFLPSPIPGLHTTYLTGAAWPMSARPASIDVVDKRS
jgi:hypothetical protein